MAMPAGSAANNQKLLSTQYGTISLHNSTQIQPAFAIDMATKSEPMASVEMMSFVMVVLLLGFESFGCSAY
jgi:hypothetical protein